MQNFELTEGAISFKELSIWFDLSPLCLTKHRKTKEKKLKQLKYYADYHLEGKKLYIDKVHVPVYNKAYEIIEKKFYEYWGKNRPLTLEQMKIDTCKRVGEKIYNSCAEVREQVKLNTVINYVSQIKREYFGKTGVSSGTLGNSKYVYLNKECNAPLGGEDFEKFKKCLTNIFNGHNQFMQILGLFEDYTNKQISQQDFKDSLHEVITKEIEYWDIRKAIEKELGYYPLKETQIKKFL